MLLPNHTRWSTAKLTKYVLTAYKVNPSILFIKNEDLFFIYFVSSSTLDGMKDPKKQRSWALP